MTKSKYIFLTLTLVVGCARPSVLAPTVPNSVIQRVEDRKLAPDPATEEVPSGIPRGDWVVPVSKGECLDSDGTPELVAPKPCPSYSGILVSEERAYRGALYKIRYREMRKTYEADRMVWSAHRELYEERLKLADRAIVNLQPSWWGRNKLSIGLVTGVVLGLVTTIAVSAIGDKQ